MTYTTTHLGISVILLLALTPTKVRKWFRDNPRLFFFTTLFSILPDVDIYLRIPHRTWTHSIFIILISGIVLLFISYLKDNCQLRKIALLITYFWLSHVLFDLTWDSVGIFYPFDTSFYNVVGGVKLNLATSTVSISGFYLQSSLQNPEAGIDQYFVNWSVERRLATFGTDTFVLSISQLTVHLAIFTHYLSKVVIPFLGSFPSVTKQKIKISKAIPALPKWIVRHGWMTLLLLFLLLFSLYAGVGNGSSYTEDSKTTTTFYVLSDGLGLYSTLIFNIPRSSEAVITLKFPTHALNFSMGYGMSDNSLREKSENKIKALETDGTVENYSSFVNEYITEMNSSIPSSWGTVDINPEQEYSIVIDLGTSISDHQVGVDVLLLSWDSDDFFIYNVDAVLDLTTDRSSSVLFSNIIALIAGVGIIGSITYSLKAEKKHTELVN